jgi:transcriptional regulator
MSKAAPARRHPSRRPTNPSRIRIKGRETEFKCLQLRKQGLAYSEIAEKLSMTPMGVSHALKRGLDRMMKAYCEDAEVIRNVELERLDEMLVKHFEFAKKGDPKSAEIVLKIMERRSKYLGLDAAQKMQVDHGGVVRIYKGVDTDKV